MFEKQVSALLRKFLGDAVDGLDADSLNISARKGTVSLKNLQIKPHAVEKLNLPVSLVAGFIGEIFLASGNL